MKRCMIFLAAAAILATLVLSPAAASIQVQVVVTGDNIVDAFYKNGGLPEEVDLSGISGLEDWRTASTATVDLTHWGANTFYFRVHQDGFFSEDNPAGFLGDIKFVGGPIIASTSESWEWAEASDTDTAPPSSGWEALTEHYGSNAEESTIWYKANNGPVASISNDAKWIWGGSNFDETDPPPVSEQWLKVTVNVVPEAATVAIWSLLAVAGIGLLSHRRRK